MKTDSLIKEFCNLCENAYMRYGTTLPLCAAETVASPFVSLPLGSFIQEKYLLGSFVHYDDNNNFIGSETLYPFYSLINSQCKRLFDSVYADARSLSGINAVTTLLMSLFDDGDSLLILPERFGGHSSMRRICARLGIIIEDAPYCTETMDLDYQKLNSMLKRRRYDGLLLCPSDITFLPELSRIDMTNDLTIIFDATQVLGLIAGGAVENPLHQFEHGERIVLMGSTHKTLPGPTCGLVMTSCSEIVGKIDERINPDYLRNCQLDHVASLILALLEMEEYGSAYAKSIVTNATMLAKHLVSEGFEIIQRNDGMYTSTHQLFLHMEKANVDSFYQSCATLGVTLNKRFSELYRGSGIRLGTQEITRYGWQEPELEKTAFALRCIMDGRLETASRIIQALSSKRNVCYTFGDEELRRIKSALHHS